MHQDTNIFIKLENQTEEVKQHKMCAEVCEIHKITIL